VCTGAGKKGAGGGKRCEKTEKIKETRQEARRTSGENNLKTI
jgi:hypothetical protein